MKTRLAVMLLSAMCTLMAQPAAAQFAKSEDAIKYRQGALFVMGQHFGRLGAMANGKAPFDAKVAQGFGDGTEGGKAKPDVWKEKAKFTEHTDKFQAEASKLAAAAKTGDLAQLKNAFGPAAQTCKACHDAFRNR
jgi:cytochrome c556